MKGEDARGTARDNRAFSGYFVEVDLEYKPVSLSFYLLIFLYILNSRGKERREDSPFHCWSV